MTLRGNWRRIVGGIGFVVAVGFDERGAGPVAGPWSLQADAGVYRLDVVLKSAAASGRVSRSIDLQDGASITVAVTGALSGAQ